jgi:PAS domain S-box-containing protein
MPVKDAQGQTTAVAFAALDLSELAKSIGDVQLAPGSHLIIMDRAGIVLAENVDASTAAGKLVAHPMLQKAIQAGNKGILEGPDADGKQKIYALVQTTPASDSAFIVAVGMDRNAVMYTAHRQLALELLALLLVTALGFWLAWTVGGRPIMQPALEVLKATQNIQAGRLDFRIPKPPGGQDHELNRIADAFNQMASSVQQREADLMLELERSEQAWEMLDLTINSLTDGLAVVDSEARMVLVNAAASKIYPFVPGITPLSDKWPQVLGLFVPETKILYAVEDLPLYKALHGQSGEAQRILVKNSLVPQGQLISASYKPLMDSHGRLGALMVFSDITELDQLQQEQGKSFAALRESQSKLLEAQRLGRTGNWEFDLASQQLFWSEEVYTLWDITPDLFDRRFETILERIHPADRDRFKQQRDEAMRDHLELNHEFRVVTPQGEVRWLHQISKTQFNEEGVAIYRAGVVQDITERKQSALALARSSDLLRRTGQMALIGGGEFSFDPLTIHWTDEIFRIFEIEHSTELSFRQAIRFFTPEAQVKLKKSLRAALANGTPFDEELSLVTAKGRRIWVRAQGQAIRKNGELVGLSGALQDITSQRRSQEQLRLLETCVSRLNDTVLITEAEPFDDPGPRIVFVNDAFVRETGYSREEVLGKTPRILQGPKSDRAELDRMGIALRKWQPVRAELINYTKAGEEFWAELDIVPVANEAGWYTHWVAVQRNITERKRADQALRDSEQRYAALFEQAPVPLWVFDTETYQFLAVNKTATRDYGYSVEEFLSMSIFDIRTETEAQRLKGHLEQQTADSSPTWEHRRKNGSVFTVRPLAKPIQYAGKSAQFVIAQDVTDQLDAENKVVDFLGLLQRSAAATQAITRQLSADRLMDEVAAQARSVVGAHQALISLYSDDDRSNATHSVALSAKYATQALEASPDGHQPGNLLSKTGIDVYDSARKSTPVIRLTQPQIASHPGWLKSESTVGQPPALQGWLAVPLVGKSGKNIGLLQLADKVTGEFTLQDEYVAVELAQMASIAIENAQLLDEVSQLNTGLEQKVARRTAALVRQEALFRAVAEQAPQVIWMADLKGRLTYLNHAWFALMGGKMEDWDGLKWFASIHPEDLPEVNANWARAVESQTPYSGVRRILDKDGSYHVMSYRAQPVLDADGIIDFWVGIDADVTEIKAIENALRLSNQELEAFSYSVSHDLRSPLNTIYGFSRLLSKQLGESGGDKERHYLSRIQAGATQMGQLIEDLLALAQVSRVQLQHEAVDLTAICQRIAGDCQTRDPDRKVDVHIEAGLHAYGDSGLVSVVLENLLGNAWKFTSHLEQASLRVGQKTDAAGQPVFFVSDNGAGFDMAYADKLFVAFQRLHQNSEFSGTGIGLATASRAIARHGGLLWAEAEVGKGATFFFTLPK